jgi:hypothetical protein
MNNKIKIKIKSIVESKTFHTVIYTVGILFILFLVFQVGMMAGFRKASFGRDWGDNYAKNFGSPHMIGGPGRMMGVPFEDFGNLPNAHGAIGKIIKVELPTIIVLDEKDNTEKVVLLNDKTEIRQMRDSMTKEELKIDNHIVVIGTPNSSGQIEAKLIRLLPSPFDLPANQ